MIIQSGIRLMDGWSTLFTIKLSLKMLRPENKQSYVILHPSSQLLPYQQIRDSWLQVRDVPTKRLEIHLSTFMILRKEDSFRDTLSTSEVCRLLLSLITGSTSYLLECRERIIWLSGTSNQALLSAAALLRTPLLSTLSQQILTLTQGNSSSSRQSATPVFLTFTNLRWQLLSFKLSKSIMSLQSSRPLTLPLFLIVSF